MSISIEQPPGYVENISAPLEELPQVQPITAHEAFQIEQEEERESYPTIRLIYRKVVTAFFRTASFLTEPVCKAREFFYRVFVVDSLYLEESTIDRLARKAFYFISSLFFAGIACITTIPGILIRFLAILLQWNAFFYQPGEADEISYKEQISMLSWNICSVPAGYSITDGGVTPWSFRIERIIEQIKEKDADLVCLYEVFDYDAAIKLRDALKSEYAHLYFNIGPRSFGASSGLFVASKIPISNPEFISFPKRMLVGKTKFCEKGIFSFQTPQAKIYTTHLQHSEHPARPTPGEYSARREEVDLLMEKIREQGRLYHIPQIVTGDLNLDEREYQTILHPHFHWISPNDEPSWGGDEFCKTLMKEVPSSPRNLDYTLLTKESQAQIIRAESFNAGYSQALYREEALSDHSWIYYEIDFSQELNGDPQGAEIENSN